MLIFTTRNYPFNRIIIRLDNLNQQVGEESLLGVSSEVPIEKIITITGQLLFGKISGSSWESSFLVRTELENLQSASFYYLIEKRKRASNDILRASQVIREVIWNVWDNLLLFNTDCENDGELSHLFRESQAETIGSENYLDWLIYTDPLFIIDDIESDLGSNWLKGQIWKTDEPWTQPEIYTLLCLWAIDESAVCLNIGDPYKAAIWLMRANECNSMIKSYSDYQNSIVNARREIAIRAVETKLANDPKQKEKTFIFECWQTWQKSPYTYSTKAAFAKDMIDKCEHLRSQKKVEDWCREWEKTHSAG